MIGIIDYGAGNLRSVANCLDRLGRDHRICSSVADLATVEVVVLPGVGQFASAMRRLRETGLREALRAWGCSGNPIVGICLGLQLLFESSEEAPSEPGLGLIPGCVVKLKGAIVPHMGWNRLRVRRETRWLSASNGKHFYFAHGYVAEPASIEPVSATACVNGSDVPAVIEWGTLRAVQFHPEKSAAAGAELLERMLAW
ncbi:MAG: imidazole glycerol phosphate synthase subunit HisH [Planctomycetes bacterium]|nr:imidazole glycerol phosphate synthase subunit HisH [Planctomycetota bacterium]